MCIAHDYCTCMDNEQYCKMLDCSSDHTVDTRIKKDRLRKQAVANQRQKIARINPATVRHCVSSAIKQIVDLLRPITPFL